MDSIIQNVLACNPNNRVAIVQYGNREINVGNGNDTYFPKIYIESDFTNNLSIAQNYQKRLKSADFLYESTQLIGDALDNTPNSEIVSPQTQLNRNLFNDLAIFIFTDAHRGTNPIIPPSPSGSYLINATNTTPNSNAAFNIFTSFKNNRNARFVVVHLPPNLLSQEAAASIASLGGSYNGSIEGYPDDPDGADTLPRFYYPRSVQQGFNLTQTEIAQISQDLCNINTICSTPELQVNGPLRTILWNQNAPSYQLQARRDCRCCDNVGDDLLTEYTINSASSISISTIIHDLQEKCFSVRIRAICDVDTISEWSDWYCILKDSNDIYYLGNSFPLLPCESQGNLELTHPDNDIINDTIDYLDYNNISAENHITGNSTSNYKASNTITLKSGFRATLGVQFRAYIEDCSIDCDALPVSARYSNFEYRISNNQEQESQQRVSSNLALTPNPTNNKVILESKQGGISSFKVSNQVGRTIIEKKANNSNEANFNLDKYPTGIYFVTITLESGDTVIKRVIRK